MAVKKYKPNMTPRLLEDRASRTMAEAKKIVRRVQRAVRDSEHLVTKSGQVIDNARKLLLETRRRRNGEP